MQTSITSKQQFLTNVHVILTQLFLSALQFLEWNRLLDSGDQGCPGARPGEGLLKIVRSEKMEWWNGSTLWSLPFGWPQLVAVPGQIPAHPWADRLELSRKGISFCKLTSSTQKVLVELCGYPIIFFPTRTQFRSSPPTSWTRLHGYHQQPPRQARTQLKVLEITEKLPP